MPRSVSWNWRLSRELAITLQKSISVLKHVIIIIIIITDCSDSLGRLLHGRHDGPGGVCVGVVQQARVRETGNIGLNVGFAKLFNGKLTLHSEHFELSLKFQILYFVTYIRVFIRY